MKLAIALNYLRNRGDKQPKGVSHELREQFNQLNRKVQTADKDWIANNPQEHERMKGDLYKLAKQMEEGGNTYAQEDKRMLHSQVKQIKHHAEEMNSVIDKQEHIEPWVVSKMGRAASDLSDVTHSLDGNIMKNGGFISGPGDEMAIYTNKVLNETHKMGGLRDLGHAWDMAEFVAERKGWNPMDIHVTLENKMKNGGEVEVLEFKIPEQYATALINADMSGLSNEDEVKLNDFVDKIVTKHGNANFSSPNDNEMDLGFCYSNDIDNLGSNCIKLLLMPSNKMKHGGSTEDFRVDAYMTLSNSGGIEVELDNRGDGLRYRYNNNGAYTEPEETFIAFDIDGEAMFVDGDVEYHLSDFMRAYAKGCMMAKGSNVREFNSGDEVIYKGQEWVFVSNYKNKIYLTNGPVNIELPPSELKKLTLNTKKNSLNETTYQNLAKQIKDKGVWSYAKGGGVEGEDKRNDLLNFMKEARLEYIKKWKKDIEKYKKHLEIETNEYAIKLKKEEIERLKNLISEYENEKYAKGGGFGVGNDLVYFIVDNDDADMLLHENFRKYIDYENLDNGDVLYKMDRRNFERFEDLAYSTSQKFEDAIEEVNSDGSYMMAKGGGVEEKEGLYVTGRTREDNTKIGEMIEEEGLYAEWNVREGYWFFPEEKDLYDALEKELENHFAEYGINARFEGIFAKGGGVGNKKEMKLYRIETLASGNKDVLTDREDNLYIYEKGILYDTEDGIKKGTSHRMSKINLTILPYKEYAKGGGVKKSKKTDFTISEYIQLEKQKLKEHNAKAHEDDRLDWADWKSELTKEDTKEYGIYYNSRMLDSNGDRGVFEYLPTNKNYSEDEYAKGGAVKGARFKHDGKDFEIKKVEEGVIYTTNGKQYTLKTLESFGVTFNKERAKSNKPRGVRGERRGEMEYQLEDLKNDLRYAKQDLRDVKRDMEEEAGEKGDNWTDADANRYGEQMNFIEEQIESLEKQIAEKEEKLSYAKGGGVKKINVDDLKRAKKLLGAKKVREINAMSMNELQDELLYAKNTLEMIEESGRFQYDRHSFLDAIKTVVSAKLNEMKTGGPTKAQSKKVGKVMHEWKAGKLHSGSKKGPIVKDQKQAVAIALSEAGLSKDAKPTGWKHKRKK